MLLFTEILDKHAPIKPQIIKRKYQPEWLTPKIIKKRNKCKLNGNIDAYKTLRNQVSAMIDIEKRRHISLKLKRVK